MVTRKKKREKITDFKVKKELGINSKINLLNQLKTFEIGEIENLKPLNELSDMYVRNKVNPARAKELSESLIFNVSRGKVERYDVQIIEALIVWENPENGQQFVISGNTRVAALKILHKKYGDNEKYNFLPIPYKKLKSAKAPTQYELLTLQIKTNDTGEKHSPLEMALKINKTVTELTERYGDMEMENGKLFRVDSYVAELFGIQRAQVSRYKNIANAPDFIKQKIKIGDIAPFPAEEFITKFKHLDDEDLEETFELLEATSNGKITRRKIQEFIKNVNHPKEQGKDFEEIFEDKENQEILAEATNITPEINVIESKIEEAVEDELLVDIDEKDIETDQENIKVGNLSTPSYNKPVPTETEIIGKSPFEKNDEDDELVQASFENLLDTIKVLKDEMLTSKDAGAFNNVSLLVKNIIYFMAETNGVISNANDADLADLVFDMFLYRYNSFNDDKIVNKLSQKMGRKKFVSVVEKMKNYSEEIITSNKNMNIKSVSSEEKIETSGVEIS